MEWLGEKNNWLLILALIGFAMLLVYYILPKFLKNYSSEKAFKLLLVFGMMSYLSFDFYKQEKYLYILFFVIGAIVFSYLILIAKKK